MVYATLGQMKKTLGQLDKWLEAAGAFAQTRSFEAKVFLGLRLAPDQFALAKQVQTACDTAKLAASRLSGKEAPSHPDTEQTLEELRARVQSVLAYLWNGLQDEAVNDEWTEPSRLIMLFRGWANRSPENAHNIIDKAWDKIGVAT